MATATAGPNTQIAQRSDEVGSSVHRLKQPAQAVPIREDISNSEDDDKTSNLIKTEARHNDMGKGDTLSQETGTKEQANAEENEHNENKTSNIDSNEKYNIGADLEKDEKETNKSSETDSEPKKAGHTRPSVRKVSCASCERGSVEGTTEKKSNVKEDSSLEVEEKKIEAEDAKEPETQDSGSTQRDVFREPEYDPNRATEEETESQDTGGEGTEMQNYQSYAELPHSCGNCGKVFMHRHSLLRHKRKRHLTCTLCCVVFRQEVDLQLHKCVGPAQPVGAERSFKCELCGQHFTQKRSLRRHEKRKHGGNVSIFPCEECNSVFFSINELKAHSCSFFSPLNAKPQVRLCDLCHIAFETEELLISHACVAGNAGKVPQHKHSTPPKNDVVFPNSSQMKKHQTSQKPVLHRKTKTFPCQKCEASFETEEELDGHACAFDIHGADTEAQAQPDFYVCEECHTIFKNERELNNHTCAVRILPRKGPCSPTREPFPVPDRVQCKECGLSFQHRRSLLRHKKRKHSNQNETAPENISVHPCSKCHLVFFQKKELQTHTCAVFGSLDSNPEIFSCPDCHMVFQHKIELENHPCVTQHDKRGPVAPSLASVMYGCAKCHVIFQCQKDVAQHTCAHTSVDESVAVLSATQMFACAACHVVFERKSALERHKCPLAFPAVDTNQPASIDMPHKCHVCGKGMMLKGSLNRHLKRAHGVGNNSQNSLIQRESSNLEDLSCPLCHEVFSHQIELENHNCSLTPEDPPASHHKVNDFHEKPFKCVPCKVSFQHQRSLRRHERKKHCVGNISSEFHTCSQCQLVFMRKTELDSHPCAQEKRQKLSSSPKIGKLWTMTQQRTPMCLE